MEEGWKETEGRKKESWKDRAYVGRKEGERFYMK